MANRLKMAMIETILRLHQRGWSNRRIARELGIDRDTVSRQLRASRESANAAISLTGSQEQTAKPNAAIPLTGSTADPAGPNAAIVLTGSAGAATDAKAAIPLSEADKRGKKPPVAASTK